MITGGASFGNMWSISHSFSFNSCRCTPNTHYKDAISSQSAQINGMQSLSSVSSTQWHAFRTIDGFHTDNTQSKRLIYSEDMFMTNCLADTLLIGDSLKTMGRTIGKSECSGSFSHFKLLLDRLKTAMNCSKTVMMWQLTILPTQVSSDALLLYRKQHLQIISTFWGPTTWQTGSHHSTSCMEETVA